MSILCTNSSEIDAVSNYGAKMHHGLSGRIMELLHKLSEDDVGPTGLSLKIMGGLMSLQALFQSMVDILNIVVFKHDLNCYLK